MLDGITIEAGLAESLNDRPAFVAMLFDEGLGGQQDLFGVAWRELFAGGRNLFFATFDCE